MKRADFKRLRQPSHQKVSKIRGCRNRFPKSPFTTAPTLPFSQELLHRGLRSAAASGVLLPLQGVRDHWWHLQVSCLIVSANFLNLSNWRRPPPDLECPRTLAHKRRLHSIMSHSRLIERMPIDFGSANEGGGGVMLLNILRGLFSAYCMAGVNFFAFKRPKNRLAV